jgi:hypothetical protein
MKQRYHLAYLMWCYRQGYVRPEDRAPMTNWMLHPDSVLNPLDIEERDALLAMADEILAIVSAGNTEPPDGHRPEATVAPMSEPVQAIPGSPASKRRLLKELRTTQMTISRGELAKADRRKIVLRLWTEEGATQREISEAATAAAAEVGGKDVSENAIYKLIKRVITEARQ